jgi:hypothetical protein
MRCTAALLGSGLRIGPAQDMTIKADRHVKNGKKRFMGDLLSMPDTIKYCNTIY